MRNISIVAILLVAFSLNSAICFAGLWGNAMQKLGETSRKTQDYVDANKGRWAEKTKDRCQETKDRFGGAYKKKCPKGQSLQWVQPMSGDGFYVCR